MVSSISIWHIIPRHTTRSKSHILTLFVCLHNAQSYIWSVLFYYYLSLLNHYILLLCFYIFIRIVQFSFSSSYASSLGFVYHIFDFFSFLDFFTWACTHKYFTLFRKKSQFCNYYIGFEIYTHYYYYYYYYHQLKKLERFDWLMSSTFFLYF